MSAPPVERDWANAILGLALTPFVIWADGFVLSDLWRWFVASEFHLRSIGIGDASGIVILAALLRSTSDEQNDRPALARVLTSVFVSMSLLLLGWALVSVIR